MHLSNLQFEHRKKDNDLKWKDEREHQEWIEQGDTVMIRSERKKNKDIVTQADEEEAPCVKTNARSKGTPFKVKIHRVAHCALEGQEFYAYQIICITTNSCIQL